MWSFRPGRWHRAVEAGGRYRATSCVVRGAVNLKTGWLILGRWMMAPEFVVAVSAPVAAHGLPPSSGWSRRRWSLSRATEQRSRSSGPRSRPACCRRRRDGRCRPPTRVCSPPLLRRRSQPSGWRRRRPSGAGASGTDRRRHLPTLRKRLQGVPGPRRLSGRAGPSVEGVGLSQSCAAGRR